MQNDASPSTASAPRGWDGSTDRAIWAPTLRELLDGRAERSPDNAAILSPQNPAGLCCSELRAQAIQIAHTLNTWGLGRNDRIATLLPGGPEAAVLMLGIMSCATYAPLSPRSHQNEIEQSLVNLKVRALIVPQGEMPEARRAAEKLDVCLIELLPESISLHCARPPVHANSSLGSAQADDLLYILQTSGTTFRPKIVPMTQRRFLGAVRHNVDLLHLNSHDRGLHVLSMNHAMGITTLLYSLMAGSQTICAPGFSATEFFGWVREFQPTWFTAPPAIHQSILRHAADHADFLAAHPPRFVRTGAAPMPLTLLREIQNTWHAPLVEAYAMSECPLITSNHAPPGACKPGSVGRPCGMEITIINDEGKPVVPGQSIAGEILLRGPHLIDGYESNPSANQAAFVDGWFRTGDLGYFDPDGFLFLTGRSKEIINRAGVKIAPREIDDVILSHPAIAEAVTFALPDGKLGEDVAVAAVLRPNATATEIQIRQFAADRLSTHKIPRRVLFVDQIPTGPTGKPQRIGLAEKLNIPCDDAYAVFAAPRTPMEETLAAVWRHVLAIREPISIHAGFLTDLGGDSLQAVAMFAELHRLLGREIPVATLLAAPTIAELARALTDENNPATGALRVPIQPRGSRTPLFCLPGMHGHAFNFYSLARELGEQQPVYGMQLPQVCGWENPPDSIPSLATLYLQQIRGVQPNGPYRLAGYSFGGYLAFELAQQLHRIGESVDFLGLFDTRGPGYPGKGSLMRRLVYHLKSMPAAPNQWPQYVRSRLHPESKTTPREDEEPSSGVGHKSVQMIRAYSPVPYDGPLVLFRAAQQPRWLDACAPDAQMGWGRWARTVQVHIIRGTHVSIMTPDHAPDLAAAMQRYLEQLTTPSTPPPAP